MKNLFFIGLFILFSISLFAQDSKFTSSAGFSVQIPKIIRVDEDAHRKDSSVIIDYGYEAGNATLYASMDISKYMSISMLKHMHYSQIEKESASVYEKDTSFNGVNQGLFMKVSGNVKGKPSVKTTIYYFFYQSGQKYYVFYAMPWTDNHEGFEASFITIMKSLVLK